MTRMYCDYCKRLIDGAWYVCDEDRSKDFCSEKCRELWREDRGLLDVCDKQTDVCDKDTA